MPVTFTRIARISGTNGPRVTASWTPGAQGGNAWLAVATGRAAAGGSSNIPSLVGNTGTWTSIESVLNTWTSPTRLTVFLCTDATTAGTLTATWDTTQGTTVLHLLELIGDAGGLIVQHPSKTQNSGLSISQALSAYADAATNMGIMAVLVQATSAPTVVPGAGWTLEAGDLTLGGTNGQTYNLLTTTPGTTTPTQEQTASASWTGSVPNLLIALECQAATAPALQPYRYVQGAQFRVETIEAAPEVLTGRTVTWDSTDTNVATVTASGQSVTVNLIGAGTANIQAHCEGIDSNLVAVNVSAAPPVLASVEVTPGSVEGDVNDTVLLTATLKDANDVTIPPTGYTIGWASSDASIAGGPGTGPTHTLSLYGAGTCEVRAWVGSIGSNIIGVTVHASGVTPVASLTVAPTSVSGNPGGTATVAAMVWDGAGGTGNILTGRNVGWRSTNPGIATVPGGYNQSVTATFVAIGSAQLIATCEGIDSPPVGVTVTAASGAYPHDYGLPRIAESAFTVPLTFSPTATTDIAGYEVAAQQAVSGSPLLVNNIVRHNGTTGSVLCFNYPTGMGGGASPGIVQFWDQWLGQSSYGHGFREIYVSHWSKIPETTFEFPDGAGWKPFGYLGYGASGLEVPAQMIFGTSGSLGQAVSSFTWQVMQQNSLSNAICQSLGADGVALTRNQGSARPYVCGRWNRVELHAVLNSAQNAADGLFEMWFDNNDGYGLQPYMRYTRIVYLIDAATSFNHKNYSTGFYGYRWDPVWGGTGTPKEFPNHLYVSHIYIAGRA